MVKSLKELRKIEKKQRKEKQILKDVKYKMSASGKIGNGISSFLTKTKSGVTKSLYDRQNKSLIQKAPLKKGRVKYGRGRPKGTVKYTDPRTGQPIGVYEYRKILTARLRKERLENLQKSVVNPRQQQILNRINQREAIQRMSPERRVIPDTYGQVPISNIMKEIDDASNIFQ